VTGTVPSGATRIGSPGLLGDLAAVAVCELTAAVALAVVQGALDPLGLAVAAAYVAVLVTPVALLGVLVLEVALRRVRSQGVHVLASGALALAAGLALAGSVHGVEGLGDLRPVAVAAALGAVLGRALVVSLVRPAEPVDDDFAGARTGW
jgi:hypothetical protein